MIETIKKQALEENIPIIMDDTLEEIKKILKEAQPINVLEIGTAVGYSAIRIAQNAQSVKHLDTIERDTERVSQAIKNIKSCNLEGIIKVIEGDAVEILPSITKKYDMIFIDAAKGKYPIFLEEAIRLLSENGIIIADNVLYKGYVLSDYNKHKQRTAVRGLRTFIKELNENDSFETILLEVGDGLMIAKKI